MSSEYRPTEATRRIGAKIREARQRSGLTQRDLADRLGCQQPAVARLEAGGVSPNVRTLERIANALELDLEWQMVSRDEDEALPNGIFEELRR